MKFFFETKIKLITNRKERVLKMIILIIKLKYNRGFFFS